MLRLANMLRVTKCLRLVKNLNIYFQNITEIWHRKVDFEMNGGFTVGSLRFYSNHGR